MHEQEVDENLQYIMGYKYIQPLFLHFMEEHIEEQNKKFLASAVNSIMYWLIEQYKAENKKGRGS